MTSERDLDDAFSERDLDDAFSKPAREPGNLEKNLKLFMKSNKLTSSTSAIAITSDLSTIQEQKIDDKSAVINASDVTKDTDAIFVADQKTKSKDNENENDSKVASKRRMIMKIGGLIQTPYGFGKLLRYREIDRIYQVELTSKAMLYCAYESLEKMVKLNLEELIESLLTIREDEKINGHGWVLRTFDASYNDIFPNVLKHEKKRKQLDHVIKFFRDKNESRYVRSVFDYSTPPFETIEPKLASSLRDLFFNDKDELTFMVTQHFTDLKDGDYGIHPTIISFENTKVTDQRIQISFNKGSMIEKTVQSKLIEHGLIDPELEFAEEVSLIIGGSNIQDFHQDIPRANTYFMEGNKEIIGWELNRNKYNEVISGKNAPGSILVDLSKDKSGLYLTLPPSSVEKVDEDNVRVKFEKGNTIFEGKTIREGKGKNGRESCTIKVNSGCRFVGDFFHAGADNLHKL